jgi:hypothetical protein
MIKKDLSSLPTTHPKYADTTVLILRDNNLEVLDASKLPRNLTVLDLRNNKIRSITGNFPKTLEFLWLENNKLERLPPFPEHIISVDTDGNPLKKDNLLELELKGITDRKLIWMTTEKSKPLFSPDDFKHTTLAYRFYPEEAFDAIKGDGKEFIEKTICRDAISESYLKRSIESAEQLLLEVEKERPTAMATFKADPDYEVITISLLCSKQDNKGGGSRILKQIQDYFFNHPLSYDKVTLESLPGARGFYEHMGFERCIDHDLCPMQYKRPVRRNAGKTGKRGRNS